MHDILDRLYQVRYPREAEEKKEAIWQVLCQDYLQQFISPGDSLLDIAAGHCEFINNIKCRKKYAVDIDPRIKRYANANIEVIIADAQKLPRKLANSIDVVFMGCFLEHLPSKVAIIRVLQEVKRVLKKGGRLLILNPNIRFTPSEYWDYFDHLTPVSDRSIVELLKALDYEIEVCLPQFVPNTIKDRLPKWPFLVRIYLRLPFLFPIIGKQMFIVARKPL